MQEKWTFKYENGSSRLFITVEGHATEGKSREAIAEFTQLLGPKTVELVVDLDKMTGYDSEARRLWQECFSPLRKQLTRMLIVGRVTPMVRMGITVVAAVASIPITFVRDLEQMQHS
jgi:hypothetical protein